MIDWNAALPLVLTGLALVCGLMLVLWLIHLPLRNAAIVDVGWGTALATLATTYADRFHLYGPDEIAFEPQDNVYRVTEEGGGPSYSFANPDFSFRQFRSNLVARWEWKPGSSVYVVWSQGRTSYAPEWDASFGSNWDALRGARSDNVFLVKCSYWFSP